MAHRAVFPPTFPHLFVNIAFVISGFNTDIEFDGTVYHVQTEDKGPPSREIMSLVYDRGTILASKRVSYEDLVAKNYDERELAERVSRQHKLICAAVKAGRLNDLKEMTARSAAAGAKTKREKVAAVAEVAAPSIPIPTTPIPTPQVEIPQTPQMVPAPVSRIETERVNSAKPIRRPLFDESYTIQEPVIEVVDIIDDAEILPPDAVVVVSELSGQERPANTKLSLELLGETNFKGGDRRTVNIMICRGTERKVVEDAQIMIKVLGSSFRPVIFHARSDANGLAKIHLQLPHFQSGRAALLIRAIAGGEEIELRRVVAQG